MKLNIIETLGVAFVNAVSRSAPKSENTLVVRVDTGRERAAAVAKYMGERASELRLGWELAHDEGKLQEAGAFQAGAAGAELASNLLLALLAGDKAEFKAQFNAFVNDAVDTGLVTV